MTRWDRWRDADRRGRTEATLRTTWTEGRARAARAGERQSAGCAWEGTCLAMALLFDHAVPEKC